MLVYIFPVIFINIIFLIYYKCLELIYISLFFISALARSLLGYLFYDLDEFGNNDLQ